MARYAATQGKDLGNNPMRAAILQTVAGDPGIRLSHLRVRVGCSAGTIQHHLNVLEREGLVQCVRANRRRWVFPAGGVPADLSSLAVLRSGRVMDLVRSVVVDPGLIQQDLTRGLSMSRKVLRAHLDTLMTHGLVEETTIGRCRNYYPSKRLFALLGERPTDGPQQADPVLGLAPLQRPALGAMPMSMDGRKIR